MWNAKLLFIFFAIFAVGCEKKLNIEVFIATKSGQNIKLGLVDVKSFELSDCIEPLKKAAEYRDSGVKEYTQKIDLEQKKIHLEQKKIQSLIEKKREIKDNLEKKYEDIKKQFIQAVKTTIEKTNTKEVHGDFDLDWSLREAKSKREGLWLCEPNKTIECLEGNERYKDYKSSIINLAKYFNEVITDYMNSIIDLEKYERENQTVLKDLDKILGDLDKKLQDFQNKDIYYGKSGNEFKDVYLSPTIFYNKLPLAYSSKKTNADGKCELRLPANKRWIIAATAERFAGVNTETYVWIVELPENFQSNDTLMLSNNNLLYSGMTPHF